ncbi:ABC transporter permease [Melissospora conviva]|uniref:ABC transporter permease n=1 Tax=Melissospora conviva TaxID=3388432 RepID=UPI003B7ECE42
MAHTTVAGAESGSTQAQLAARYGLGAAGARPSLATYTRTLWSYRHFILAYSTARVTSSFSKTQLGQLWQVLTPLSNAAVYYLIFGLILQQTRGVENFIPYLCTGLFLFSFTSGSALAGTTSITSNLGLIRAMHFPRACLPLAHTFTQLQNALTAMVVLGAIVLISGEPLTLKWLLIVPILALLAVFNAGLTMLLARLGARSTDLKQVMPFVMRAWMYASGVLYSVDLFRAHLPGWAAQILEFNPLLVYIELGRYSLMESAPLASSPVELWLLGVGWALVMGIGGFIFFWRGEKEYGRG